MSTKLCKTHILSSYLKQNQHNYFENEIRVFCGFWWPLCHDKTSHFSSTYIYVINWKTITHWILSIYILLGYNLLFVYFREKHERSREPVHNDILRSITEALTIPVIANGGSLDIKTFAEMEKYKHQTCCTSVMVARAAQWNLSIFRYK
jgi:hypothetical protein